MTEKDVLEKLKDDEHYYGEFGKKYLSNSDIGKLLLNPMSLHKSFDKTVPLVVGGYFHTAILEPDKLKKYKIIKSSTRNTKTYKETSGGEICLLEHEVDMIESMTDKILSNDTCRDLIRDSKNQYEVPGIANIEGRMWKGKADIINLNEKLIVDLKTTNDIHKFQYSAKKYNYDSQAYIYKKIFGYDFLFLVIDKNTNQIGIYDCSDQFYRSGLDKVQRAVEAYELFFNSEDFDPNQFFINKTL
tara:strand:- start:424 stop:1155 length:732 start_codon:yes stop_codon:yes gene_type:complete